MWESWLFAALGFVVESAAGSVMGDVFGVDLFPAGHVRLCAFVQTACEIPPP